MIPKTIIHLLSGGIDSTVLLYNLAAQGHKIHCVLIDYGQRHIQELTFAKAHCHRLNCLYTTLTLPQLKGSELTDGAPGPVVPNRNAVLLSHAVNVAVVAGADTVTYAPNKDDEALFPDCRMAFVQAFNTMLTVAEIPVEVCTPFIHKTKREIVSLGRQLGVNLMQTWSCYRGGVEPCGQCEACKKRAAALSEVVP